MTFLNYAGAIKYYGRVPTDSAAMPFFIQKGSGEMQRSSAQNIGLMVGEDPEADRWITRYQNRWWWKTGISAVGFGMFAGGVAWTGMTATKDENGRQKDGSMGGVVLGVTGIGVCAAPWLGWLDFIWDDMPKQALDTYNRNHKPAR
jgi:hypothetical protein